MIKSEINTPKWKKGDES